MGELLTRGKECQTFPGCKSAGRAAFVGALLAHALRIHMHVQTWKNSTRRCAGRIGMLPLQHPECQIKPERDKLKARQDGVER
jgi:hypothetical protein